jgi:hypothetical protein
MRQTLRAFASVTVSSGISVNGSPRTTSLPAQQIYANLRLANDEDFPHAGDS